MNKIEVYKKYIIYNNQKFFYNIKYKNVKKLTVRIQKELEITCPYYVRNDEIINFLYKNIEKINSIYEKNNENEYYNLNKNIIRILEKNYKIIINLNSKKNTWKVIEDEIIINLKNIDEKEKVIRKILKKYAEKNFINRVNELSELTKINFNSIKVKFLKRRWGYCDKNRNIVISTQAAILDRNMVDYIIIHELCHILEHNHSKQFWNLVAKFCPDYKNIKKKIKEIYLI